ncbi:MAG TPA: fatty acid desaturase [Tepidisphaeraceae bacterium]|jgi:fatty acid desaturase|nr:fatty acid desaturase [Tepidisphaeraceae bacterium]
MITDAPPIADDPELASSRQLSAEYFRIPSALNGVVVILQLTAILACFWAASVVRSGWHLALLAAGFALLMVGVYSIIHEAEHGVLFASARWNTIGGVIMAAFFPGPFHLLRQGHIGHHLRNRSDDEAFDYWFDGESPAWKWIQWIGILTGGFYVMVVLGTAVVLVLPFLLNRKWFKFDRPTLAFLDALNPRYARIIQIEAIGVIALHVTIVWLMRIPILHYLALYAAFGFLWSALQYVHHYDTERHVTRGARNVWIGWPIDKLWLNHNWHRTHHEHPTVSWRYLERVAREVDAGERPFLPWVYVKMWRGPRRASERVENRFAGKVIR